jgi:hypothetical protein
MRKGIAVLLVVVMSMGTMATASGPMDMGGPDFGDAACNRADSTTPKTEAPMAVDAGDPMLAYLDGIDAAGPKLAPTKKPLEPLPEGGQHPLPPMHWTDAVLLYEDPSSDRWLPLPSREDILSGEVAPASLANGTQYEIHGKLFESIVEENTTYYDDIGIADVPINISFDGEPVAINSITGNRTTVIDPFGENGNGTFLFTLDLDRPAGEYELVLGFEGWPGLPHYVYYPLTYRAIVYVNHPTIIDRGRSGHDLGLPRRRQRQAHHQRPPPALVRRRAARPLVPRGVHRRRRGRRRGLL